MDAESEKEVRRCYAADFEDGEKAVSQGMLMASRSRKRHGHGLPLRASRRKIALPMAQL